jgi:hypothetical protein
MTKELIQKIPDGDLDIIGDIHGEIGALCTLLDRLGYDSQGRHRQKRTLVFVGDLVDRGPNSVAVVDVIKTMFEHGNALVVAGNHEINILRQERKHGNHWFYGESEKLFSPKDTDDEHLLNHTSFSQQTHSEKQRQEILDFFSILPIALEREDLRVVHACWHEESINNLRTGEQDLMKRFQELESNLLLQSPKKTFQNTQKHQEHELFLQNQNPIKVTTSGLEKKAENVFTIGGKARYTQRVLWWEAYEGPPVIFGHYWRRRGKGPYDIRKAPPPYLFGNTSEFGWLNQTFCVDYSAGARYVERATGKKLGTMGAYLCAFRTHGKKYSLLFDDGRSVSI